MYVFNLRRAEHLRRITGLQTAKKTEGQIILYFYSKRLKPALDVFIFFLNQQDSETLRYVKVTEKSLSNVGPTFANASQLTMLTPNTASDNPKMEADLILRSFYEAVIVCEELNTASIVSQTSLRRASLSETQKYVYRWISLSGLKTQ